LGFVQIPLICPLKAEKTRISEIENIDHRHTGARHFGPLKIPE
jgi:hypothetical protein